MKDGKARNGVHAMPPREKMNPHARRLRDTYAITPGIRLIRREFGFYCLEEWHQQGLDPKADRAEVFHYDPPGAFGLGHLGWCEAAFDPPFEERVIEERGGHELIQDFSGRHLLVFKGRRSGFMPEYVDHPVKDMKTWRDNCKWRLDPDSPDRFSYLEAPRAPGGDEGAKAVAAAGQGKMISQRLAGGYMYLRSLIGPEGIMYAFHDMPDVLHDCMAAWLKLADAVIEKHQRFVTIDEIFFAEDICYNHGPLCSPDTIKEFFFPYYQQLISNLKSRQMDPRRRLHVQVDTDGLAEPIIPLYREAVGLDAMSPFEVAAGCDVVEIAARFPGLAIFGGIDKRVLAKGKSRIDAMVERILPPMRERGGYIPTCDHGVPAEVPLENYMHYRERCIELGG